MHANPVMVLKCWIVIEIVIVYFQCTLYIFIAHCTFSLHIAHFHCTLHIFIAHCTFSLHIVHFHCTYYPFPQEMISFWTLFTSHNSEKCEKVLGKKSNKVLGWNTCRKDKLCLSFWRFALCSSTWSTLTSERLLSDRRRCLIKPNRHQPLQLILF